jgi:putative transposase
MPEQDIARRGHRQQIALAMPADG